MLSIKKQGRAVRSSLLIILLPVSCRTPTRVLLYIINGFINNIQYRTLPLVTSGHQWLPTVTSDNVWWILVTNCKLHMA